MHDLCYNPSKQFLLNFQINNLKRPQIPQMLCVNQKTLGMTAAKHCWDIYGCFPEFVPMWEKQYNWEARTNVCHLTVECTEHKLFPLEDSLISFCRMTGQRTLRHQFGPSTRIQLFTDCYHSIFSVPLNHSARYTHWPRYSTLTFYIKLNNFGNEYINIRYIKYEIPHFSNLCYREKPLIRHNRQQINSI